MRYLLALACVLYPPTLLAQGGQGGQPAPQIQYVTVAPSGACGRNNIRLLTPNGVVYTCVSGTWTVATTPGGGALPAGPTNSYQCNAGGGVFCGTTMFYDPTHVGFSVGFSGSGLNDLSESGSVYSDGATNPNATFEVQIDATGTPDTFKWRKNAGAFSASIPITGAAQTLSDGIIATFVATTGHTLSATWTIYTYPETILGNTAAGEALFSIDNSGPQISDGLYILTRLGANSQNRTALHLSIDDANDGVGVNRAEMRGMKFYIEHDGAGTVTDLTALYINPSNYGGAVTNGRAFYTEIDGGFQNASGLWVFSALQGESTGSDYGVYVATPDVSGGGSMGTHVGFYSGDLCDTATNAYHLWTGDAGVLRIKSDKSFDGACQGIQALYNPQVTPYVAGVPNYERLIQGEWNGNVSEIGNYAGGTGTARKFRLLGNGIDFGTASNIAATTFVGAGTNDGVYNGTYTGATLTYCGIIDATGTPDTFQWGTNGGCDDGATGVAITGANQTLSSGVVIKFATTTGHTLADKWSVVATAASDIWQLLPSTYGTVASKSAASAVAPGAGSAAFRWLAGTNAGTCKLVGNAGTSATEVTIIDNVGSGC